MERYCSFQSICGAGSCGPSRGSTDLVSINKCVDDISIHLANLHLSRDSISEKGLILARAGLSNLSALDLESMNICPKHRHGFGKYWRPPKSCRYPGHTGKKGKAGKYVINSKIAAEIRSLYGKNIPVGSRKYFMSLSN